MVRKWVRKAGWRSLRMADDGQPHCIGSRILTQNFVHAEAPAEEGRASD